jgi:hypothetical protein
MTNRELRELRRLTDQAFDLRGGPYYIDACRAIGDWWELRYSRSIEREEEQLALLRVLDSTDPDRIMRRRRAA